MDKYILITGGSGFIGTNLINELINSNYTILNIDKVEPKIQSHKQFWKFCNILDKNKLEKIFLEFNPDYLIHLAAKTDTESSLIEDYSENIQGTKNVLAISKKCKSIEKLIITSTQFVHQFHGLPNNDEDFAPHTVYGVSKMMTEKDTREANLDCAWVIVRPTNIWGPWHKRYPYEFWRILSEKKYYHPGFSAVQRSYGYVGNVVDQLLKILKLDGKIINKKVLYLGDKPIDVFLWTNEFSKALINKPVRRVPRFCVKGLACFGEILNFTNVSFPLKFSRYRSMVTPNPAPMEKTFQFLGEPLYSLEEGIEITIDWLNKYHPHLIHRK